MTKHDQAIAQYIFNQTGKIKKRAFALMTVVMALALLNSCQKELDYAIIPGTTPIVLQKPKLGTEWYYRFYTFYSYSGGLATSENLVYKAKSEEVINGEKWLQVVNVAADTTVYLLQEKADGLYQYINNNGYLFCKYPAAVNDRYTTFYSGEMEDFIVKAVNDTISTDIGDIATTYYETYKGSHLIDQVWYDPYTWVVWKQVNRKIYPLGTAYFKYSVLYLSKIIY
jgi:hypothetical protein